MVKVKGDPVAHYLQMRNQASDMWDRVYSRFIQGSESREMLLMSMTLLNSADQVICDARDITSEQKAQVWRECR